MKHFIITGTSRGLGAALAMRLAVRGHHLVCISRRENEALTARAASTGASLTFIPQDLSDIRHMDQLVEDIFATIDFENAEAIVLVNNAGTLEPIRPVSRCTSAELTQNLQTNLVAPILLAAGFLSKTENLPCNRRIINVSSGAGSRPYYGWGCYCSAKAGIDMFARCVALEAEHQENPVKIVSFGPGVMDTDMQAAIRSTPQDDFVQLPKFLDLKKDGKLLPADTVAEALEGLIFSDRFPQGEYIDVYALLEGKA